MTETTVVKSYAHVHFGLS